MKTTTTILLALCFSSLIITGLGAAATPGDTFTLTATDSDTTTTGNFPVSYTVAGGTAATAQSSPAAIKGAIASTDAGNTVTVTYANGLPLVSTYAVATQTTASPPATGSTGDTLIVVLSIGTRVVGVSVGGTASTAKTSSATITTQGSSISACGDYYWDAVKGLLYFAVTATSSCTVTVSQVNAVIGVIQYNENTFTGGSSLASQITSTASNAVTGAVAMVNGQSTGSTLVYYSITNPTATGTGLTSAQQTSIQQAVQAAIYAKTYTVTGNTQLNGYAITAPASASATTAAPSASVQSNILQAYPKSHSRMVAIVGVFTTVLAAFFGLAF